MKYFSCLTMLFLLVLACGKENDPPPVDPPPIDQPPVVPPAKSKDTLSAGWTLDTSFTGTNNDVFFINSKGYLSAEQIYTSGDGGNSWQQIYKAEYIVENIAMADQSNAIFSSVYGSQIFITHNGGNSFDSVRLDDPRLNDVFFAGPKLAFAIGVYFWRSEDAGDHWTKVVDANKPEFPDTYKSLFFLNEQTGWIAGGGGIYKTIDGGKKWTAQFTPEFIFGQSGSLGGNAYFTDSLHGAITDQISFGVTTNSGLDWIKRFDLQRTYHDIHFVNETTGYLTDNQYIWKTTDSGLSWEKEVVLPDRRVIELHFTDANHGWACGPGFMLRYAK